MGLKGNFKGHLVYTPGFRQDCIHAHPRGCRLFCQVLFWIMFIFSRGELGREDSNEEHVCLKSTSRVIFNVGSLLSLLCQGQSILQMPYTLTFSSKCICANLMNHQGF